MYQSVLDSESVTLLIERVYWIAVQSIPSLPLGPPFTCRPIKDILPTGTPFFNIAGEGVPAVRGGGERDSLREQQ